MKIFREDLSSFKSSIIFFSVSEFEFQDSLDNCVTNERYDRHIIKMIHR